MISSDNFISDVNFVTKIIWLQRDAHDSAMDRIAMVILGFILDQYLMASYHLTQPTCALVVVCYCDQRSSLSKSRKASA